MTRTQVHVNFKSSPLHNYVTSVADTMTDEAIRTYFVNTRFCVGYNNGVEDFAVCTDVEVTRQPAPDTIDTGMDAATDALFKDLMGIPLVTRELAGRDILTIAGTLAAKGYRK